MARNLRAFDRLAGRFERLVTAWREWGAVDVPPPPDPAWPTEVDGRGEAVVDVVSGGGWHRIVITKDQDGIHRLQLQAWAPDWEMSHEAMWRGHDHIGSYCDSLPRAQALAREALVSMGEAPAGEDVEQ